MQDTTKKGRILVLCHTFGIRTCEECLCNSESSIWSPQAIGGTQVRIQVHRNCRWRETSKWKSYSLESCLRLKKCLTCVRGSCPSCAIVLSRSKFGEDHEVQLEFDDESKAADGSVFVCLRQLPSLSQREDSRGLSWFWSVFVIAMKWVDVAGRKMRPRVFGW